MSSRKNAPKAKSGSPPTGEPEYLLVGKLRRPHGLSGDLLMEVVTDFPERLQPGTDVFVGAAYYAHRIAVCRKHSDGLLVRFEAIDTPGQAGLLRNQLVYVSGANRPSLPEGQFYHHQLLGLEVINDDGRSLGHLSEILETGANDVYVVHMPVQRDLLLPAIDTVILQVDLKGRTIRVRIPDGLVIESPRGRSGSDFPGRKTNAGH